ncbi:MAG TPA: glucose-6-phosphate isomerase family protein [Parafilimonas sp.]|nr:glucose-6-phosphate isomerase family protein [Parafilimonas sp.]
MSKILEPEIKCINEKLEGNKIERINRRIKNLKDIFFDKAALEKLNPETIVYEVESYLPVALNTEGGLFYGITYIHPGVVGNEYFMTKGHFHKIRNRGEFYCTLQGEGMLILMDEDRNTWAEKMYPGSIHYIKGNTAHRTANTGNSILSFSAFWPSDAGHDYAIISEQGFSKILINKDGKPALVDR